MWRQIALFFPWLRYQLSQFRHCYSHRAVAQRHNKQGETVIIYTLLGKRDLYEIRLKYLMDDPKLLAQFHPCQAAKFGALSMGDVLFSMPIDQREQALSEMRSKMLDEAREGVV